MGQGVMDHTSLRVPTGEGYIVGDILRKYAVRSVGTWQVVGYKLDSQAVNFGLSNGSMVSYLELLKGQLVSSDEDSKPGIINAKLCTFEWNGECFTSGGFELRGLNKSVGDKLVACIYFGRGHRSADQNREVVRSVTKDDANGFFIVPSSHSIVSSFRYSVSPIDDRFEWLNIEADSGVVPRAINAAVRTLSGLDI